MPLNLVPQPGPGVNLQNTQDPILQNFTNIDANFSVDHQAFASTHAGYHNKLTMPQQTPAPAGIANTAVLYYFTDNQLYINKNNGTPIPLTLSQQAASPGFTVLPSGIRMAWGTVGLNVSALDQAVPLPSPFFTTVYNVQMSIIDQVGSPTIQIRYQGFLPLPGSPTQFFVRALNNAGPFTMMWFAIGV